MAVKATKVVEDKLKRPTEEGWYWYYATEEETKELSVEMEQVCKVYRTKEGLLVAEFVREVRRVAKLMGTWGKKLEPS